MNDRTLLVVCCCLVLGAALAPAATAHPGEQHDAGDGGVDGLPFVVATILGLGLIGTVVAGEHFDTFDSRRLVDVGVLVGILLVIAGIAGYWLL